MAVRRKPREGPHRHPPAYRDETEWIELVGFGVDVRSGTTADQIVEAAGRARWPEGARLDSDSGDGHAAEAVAGALRDIFEGH